MLNLKAKPRKKRTSFRELKENIVHLEINSSDYLTAMKRIWAMHAKPLQSCLNHDPMDCSPPGSSVHGILEARILQWVAIPFSRGSSQPREHSNSCPLSRWCHPTISSSVIPFSSLQSFPASESFQMSQLFTSDQSIGVSASTLVLPMNI